MPEPIADQPFKAAMLRTHLQGCGYRASLLRGNFPVSDGLTAPVVAFAHPPADARSACIAVIDAEESSAELVASFRPLAAPVVFVCGSRGLEWWRQGVDRPGRVGRGIPPGEVPRFFETHGRDFTPDAIYRAKTWGRFDSHYQLTFVDIGLMPLVESQIGERLQSLIVRNVQRLKSLLGWETLSDEQGHWLLKAVFWLVSAKILRDKEVGHFSNIDLSDANQVLASLAEHYDTQAIKVTTKRQHAALMEIASDVNRFSSLSLATTESLAYVYENTMISRATRQALGTHSTPSYLVDYIVGHLARWVEQMDPTKRNVFEPACGHAAFLVSAMRLLTELLPGERSAPQHRRRYLRERIHGCDVDAFALEIARLSLSLTDIPNPDGWDLVVGDMFVGDGLEASARDATIMLANPPFENFSVEEREWYRSKGSTPGHVNKAAELLRRTLPELPTGAIVGVVVPQTFLHSANATAVRRLLLESFEIQEICLFPDKVFAFSDMESAILLARKVAPSPSQRAVRFRRVRERELPHFRLDYTLTSEHTPMQERFRSQAQFNFWIPDLDDVWAHCVSYPRLHSIADVGQGLTYKGSNLPRGAVTYSESEFPSAVRGFLKFGSGVMIHDVPTEYWMNLDRTVIRRPGHGTRTGVSQVLLNEAPASRNPWRLKGLLDWGGHAVAGRFNVVRPDRESGWLLESLWALCNSPIANAFAFAHSGRRHNDAGMLRNMPVPLLDQRGQLSTAEAVRQYLEYVNPSASAFLRSPIDPRRARDLLLRIDNEVLRMYKLPRELEWQLLDFFADWPRTGVPFAFNRYFPSQLADHLSLADYLAITTDWPQTNRRREALIHKKIGRTISPEERAELDRLQALAVSGARLVAPLPLKELEAAHLAIVGRASQ